MSPVLEQLAPVLQQIFQLILALILGGLVGAEREIHGRWAGLRTHMLVALGCTVFTIIGNHAADGNTDVTRVIQGIATGIGFLGAGTILKMTDKVEVKGLTTAASIWLAATVGTAVGVREYALAISATLATLIVLALLKPLERRIPQPENKKGK